MQSVIWLRIVANRDILWEGHLDSYLDGRKKAYALGVSDLLIDWAYYDYLRAPYRHPTNNAG